MIIGLVGDLDRDRDWAVGRLPALGQRGDVEVACRPAASPADGRR